MKRGYITSLSKEDERELVKRLLDKIYDEVRLKNFGFHFIISYDCNLRCVYCYEDPILNGCACLPKCRITKEQVDKAYEIIIEKDKDKTGRKTIHLYGGEPFLVENYEMLEYIVQKGKELGYVFSVTSNGYDLDKYMDYLEEKYKRNCLTPKELEELQRKVREMSDGQLEDRLFKGWQEDILDDSSVSAERLAILKRKVDKSIFPKYRTKMLISWGRIVAAILLPIFVFATFYFYQETRSLSSGEVLFSTFAEEHANLTLPDGTKVTMNSNSSLTYSPKDFNRDERCVDFLSLIHI